ncbi:MAG: hypothetical protein DWQ05_07975 [Calditrichaeota bacterium]|nr:MAG: hypothetical protein DWQ05_07975 [Calditrichota bacterium]
MLNFHTSFCSALFKSTVFLDDHFFMLMFAKSRLSATCGGITQVILVLYKGWIDYLNPGNQFN